MAESKGREPTDDEDEYIISMEASEPKLTSRGGPPPLKAGLDMKGIDTERTDLDALGVQEQSVLVTFDLPDGSQASEYFKLGHTIELLKSFVASEFSINMHDQLLFLGDELMLDPLTLLDYPSTLQSEEVYIRVEGSMEESAKK